MDKIESKAFVIVVMMLRMR